MMNMEDGDGLDNCKRDNGARGMGVRGTEVVLAPRGETGSFTQMPSITHLHASSAKNFALAGPQYWPGHRGLSPLTGPLCTLPGPLLSLPQVPLAAPLIFQFFHFHIFHHTRFEPPISVAHQEIPRQAQDTVEENPTASRTTTTDTHTAAISSTPTPTHISHIGSDDILTVLLGGSLPGTNNAGNTEACPGQQWLTDTFFIDCGADDVFMDAELATRLNIPLVKIPVPIKLRLADGDSSSMITHRTLPLQLHIGRHVETIGFYVTSLCHGIILGYSWLERHNPKSIGNPEWWILDPVIVWRIVVLGRLEFKDLESLQVPRIFRRNLASRNQRPSDQTSDSAVDPDIDLSLFKDPSMDLDLGIKKPVPQVSSNTSKSVSFAETIQTEVYPFLEASPVSETPIPPEIYKEFSSVFSESQADILPSHRSFDCTINLSSSAEPSYGRIYQLTREEDKQKDKLRLCMDYRGLNKQTLRIGIQSVDLRNASYTLYWKIFTTLDLRGAYNLLRIKEGDEPKTAFITKYGQFEFLVMPFGLANAPAQFQRMMNSLFRHMISKFVLVYLDDIVVYSDNLEDHKEHVRQVLQILKDNNLFCKAEKCHFYQTEIKYWAILFHQMELQWTRQRFLLFKIGRLQKRQMNNAEGNYDIYDKELLAVVESFKHWRHLLARWTSSSDCLVRSQESGILYVDQETDSSDRLVGRWNFRNILSLLLTDQESLTEERTHCQDEKTISWTAIRATFQRIIDPDNVLDLQVAMADLDLHVLVHSTVLDKVFVQEADWPLIIADFLAGEDNVWIEEISEDWLELCKKELKNFRFRDNTFVRILNDGKSTATYMPSNDRVQVMKHYHESLAHLKYGSISI
ncbi:hypothetical protein BASA50_010045 [Batrachochytrium salamandrivorans]|uniref:RNA-directed DNA polymerase n=1 Tax=Batrachochytrium salamandrivorans TaxID=1357716 RepID=A0ABQ8EZI0_9FUNG|nr:hypothetical protein BASA50_010045 [Batrachochytrium salamandrivorans]